MKHEHSSTDEYECAINYAGKTRPAIPPVYNENRLKEKPIPNISQPFDNMIENSLDQQSMDSPANSEIENAMDGFGNDEIEQSIDPLVNSEIENAMNRSGGDKIDQSIDPLAESEAENVIDRSIDDEIEQSINGYEKCLHIFGARNQNQFEVNEPLEIEVKEEPELLLDDVDISELDALLRLGENSHESFEDIDDDIMIQKLNVYPKPIETQYEIKENDTLCGNIPFKSYVSIMASVRLQYFK